jgi:hypothetical protein
LVATHDLDTVPFAVGKRFRLFQKATTELLPSWNGRVRLVTMADATLDFAYREATGTLDISLRAFTDPEQALPVWCRGMLQVSSIDWHGITYQNRTLALAGKIYAVSQEEGA